MARKFFAIGYREALGVRGKFSLGRFFKIPEMSLTIAMNAFAHLGPFSPKRISHHLNWSVFSSSKTILVASCFLIDNSVLDILKSIPSAAFLSYQFASTEMMTIQNSILTGGMVKFWKDPMVMLSFGALLLFVAFLWAQGQTIFWFF